MTSRATVYDHLFRMYFLASSCEPLTHIMQACRVLSFLIRKKNAPLYNVTSLYAPNHLVEFS